MGLFARGAHRALRERARRDRSRARRPRASCSTSGSPSSWATLALAFLVMGMFDATMDAAMNAHSIGVQRLYGRSILQRFHGHVERRLG